jgi:hypothetical protein
MKKTVQISLLLTAIALFSFTIVNKKAKVYPEIDKYIQTSIKEFDKIPTERKEQLKKISLYIKSKISAEKKASLLFICTHNSRRSHMGQIWAQTAANYYGVEGVFCYSGGTESTAFNPRAIKALTKSGFKINKTTESANPLYEVKYANDAPSIKAFSKKYSDEPNPKNNFCAIMTCSHADKTCPNVEGSSLRVAIPYEDPKEFDGKAEEEAKYDERCRQIATEMLFIFSQYTK